MIPIFYVLETGGGPERLNLKVGDQITLALSLKDSYDRTLSQVLWRGNIDEDGYIQEQIWVKRRPTLRWRRPDRNEKTNDPPWWASGWDT